MESEQHPRHRLKAKSSEAAPKRKFLNDIMPPQQLSAAPNATRNQK
jgi:hypothetical protein